MHEKNKYRHIPWNRYNLEKYRDIDFWSYRPALARLTSKTCQSSALSLEEFANQSLGGGFILVWSAFEWLEIS